MRAYLDIVQRILDEGSHERTRTGTDGITIAGAIFEHDMSEGYPLLTTKRMSFRTIATELEFFIKGKTDKQWLLDRGNHFWDEWANLQKAPYGHDEESKRRMKEERDLGPIYGFQWRHFGAKYESYDTDYTGQGVDQLKNLVNKLKEDPRDRRLIVSAWNPLDLHLMALPPCHYAFQVNTTAGRLNLFWDQRSIDTMIGLPCNIASYALLLHLLSKEAGIPEGRLVGFLSDVHIYVNHVEGTREQLTRKTSPLPRIETENFTSVFEWKVGDTQVIDYKSHPRIKFDIAV